MIVALDLCGNDSRSGRNHSTVLSTYACARGFFARLASGTFLTRLDKKVFQHPV